MQATGLPLFVNVYRVNPAPSARIGPNCGLFSICTVNAAAPDGAAEAALVVG